MLATGFITTTLNVAFLALWNFILEIELLNITDITIRETPGNILILLFFISMIYNAYVINIFAKLYGFRKKK